MNIDKAMRRDNRKNRRIKKVHKGKAVNNSDLKRRIIQEQIKIKEKLEEELMKDQLNE